MNTTDVQIRVDPSGERFRRYLSTVFLIVLLFGAFGLYLYQRGKYWDAIRDEYSATLTPMLDELDRNHHPAAYAYRLRVDDFLAHIEEKSGTDAQRLAMELRASTKVRYGLPRSEE